MKKFFISAVAITALGLTSCKNETKQENNSQAQETVETKEMNNKTLIQTAMHELFVNRDVTALDKYWADDYIQHNPTISDGKTDLVSLIKNLSENFKYESGLIIANGDLVMIQGRYTGFAPEPMVVVDIFRIENGKIKEHWDVMQTEVPAEKAVNGNAMFPIEAPTTDSNDNKQLVQNYLNDLFVKKDAKLVEKYWGNDMIQHNPNMPNGLDVLRNFVANTPSGFKYEQGLIVSEGNLVMVHGYYEGWGPKPLVAVDIFRIENGKIVEHWDVMQEFVPDNQTKSGRTMKSTL